MIVSKCCVELLDVVGTGDTSYYVCKQCGNPTEPRFVLELTSAMDDDIDDNP